jgi:hypothetical protein
MSATRTTTRGIEPPILTAVAVPGATVAIAWYDELQAPNADDPNASGGGR